MSIDDAVFKAIIAMDSYNRGYNPGIVLTGTQLGDATLTLNSTSIPNSQDDGFFAQAYDWNGETIISYRGTDDIDNLLDFVLSDDVRYGWTLGGGYCSAPQGELAIKFYNYVKASTTNNIELTGHSLGGGLAGYVGSLYGEEALLFDNEPFELSAENAFYHASAEFENRPDYTNHELGSEMLGLIYGGNDPWAVDRSSISGYAVSGESLEGLREWQSTPVNTIDPGLNFLTGGQLHSQALLVTLLFGEEEVSPTTTDWKAFRPYFLPNLFNDTIGHEVVNGEEGVTGEDLNHGNFSSIMRTAIAYSAIDEGERPFGDAGIRALFNDANDAGKALGSDNVSATMLAAAPHLGMTAVHFAGQIAVGKLMLSDKPLVEEGVLGLSDDAQTLAADFSDDLWKLGNGNGAPTENIQGKAEIKQLLLPKIGWLVVEDLAPIIVRSGMQWLWNDDSQEAFDRYVIPTVEGPLTTTIKDRTSESEKATFFVGGEYEDSVTGTKDDDFLAGGLGGDTLDGAGGDDFVYGGDGDDWISGGTGRNYLLGGDGKDTVFFGSDPLETVDVDVRTVTADNATYLELDQGEEGLDRALDVERVKLSWNADAVRITQKPVELPAGVLFDGDAALNSGSKDLLDFSGATAPVYIDYACTNDLTEFVGQSSAPFAVELYADYSPILQTAQWAWGALIPRGEPSGQGAYNGTGLRFTDFEHVIGSSGDDVMSLWRLSPGGELTTAQRTQLDVARLLDGSGAGGNPGAIAAFNTQRTELAGLVPQNQQDVLIEGGAGNDAIIGTETGADRIYGGTGNDTLMAGAPTWAASRKQCARRAGGRGC